MRKLVQLILILVPLIGTAQEVSLWSTLDTNTIRIGEQTHLRLQLRDLKKGTDVVWPEINDTLSKAIEVVDPGYPEGLLASGSMSMEMNITITAWDSGHYAIRPLKVTVNGKELYSEAFLLNVETMEVDTTKAPLDIKPILEEPFSLQAWLSANWPYIAGALAILAILYLLLKIRRTGKGNLIPMAAPPVEDPINVILLKLNRMKEEKTWTEGKMKGYYSELTDKLRDFLEIRYGINAHEFTSAEILDSLRSRGLPTLEQERVKAMLYTSDMVKFAKEKPTELIASAHLDESIAFIQHHRIIETGSEKE